MGKGWGYLFYNENLLGKRGTLRLFCEPVSLSLEPQVSFFEPRKITAKNSKNRHNAHYGTLHGGCFTTGMGIPDENGMTFSCQTGPTRRNRTLTISYSFSEFPTKEKQGSGLISQKQNSI